MLSLWGDIIVALLLVATIGYSVVLNRRLTAVRSDRDKFETLVRNLNSASQRAETAVAGLRATADELSRKLEKKVDEARALADDLVYMIERGSGIADKLAHQVRAGRDALKPDFALEARPEPRPAPRAELRPARDEHEVERVARPAAAMASAAITRAVPQRQSRTSDAHPAFISSEPHPETRRVETSRAETSRLETTRPEPARPEFPRPEFQRIEPRVTPASAALAAMPGAPGDRSAAPSRAERDLLRALAARRR